MVNLGIADFYISPRKGLNLKQVKAGAAWDDAQHYRLTDGMIVAYDARYWHHTVVPEQLGRRMSLIIRRWKPGWQEYICDYIQRLPGNWG